MTIQKLLNSKEKFLPKNHKTLQEDLSRKAHKKEYNLSEEDLSLIAFSIIEYCKGFPKDESLDSRWVKSEEIAFYTREFMIVGVYFHNGTYSIGIANKTNNFGLKIIIPSDTHSADEAITPPTDQSRSEDEDADKAFTPTERGISIGRADELTGGLESLIGETLLPHEI
jgi:hypothetical protein